MLAAVRPWGSAHPVTEMSTELSGGVGGKDGRCVGFTILQGAAEITPTFLKVNKNQTKQGTQKILLFIKSTYDAFFFKYF